MIESESESRVRVGRQSMSRPEFGVTGRIKATLTKKGSKREGEKRGGGVSLFTQVRVGRRREDRSPPGLFPARFLTLKGGRSQLLRSNNTNNKDEFAFFLLFLISTPPLRSSRLSLRARSKGRARDRKRAAKHDERREDGRRGGRTGEGPAGVLIKKRGNPVEN